MMISDHTVHGPILWTHYSGSQKPFGCMYRVRNYIKSSASRKSTAFLLYCQLMLYWNHKLRWDKQGNGGKPSEMN